MTKLLSEAIVLQNKLGLGDEHIREIEQAMRNYAADSLNVGKILIEKRESPDTIRKFMAPHGLSYDGKSKTFN
jgi:hypothetical protein